MTGRVTRAPLAVLAVAFLMPAAAALLVTGPASSAAGLKGTVALRGPQVFGWGFQAPRAVSSDGAHVWVANGADNKVIELSASTGAGVNVLSGPSYQFNDPAAISSDGTHVWVANGADNKVIELSALTGALVQVLSGSDYQFNEPDAISSDGTHVWVANQAGNSVTELSAATGALIYVLTDSDYPTVPVQQGGEVFSDEAFNKPAAISSDGTHVWVVGGSAVTELSALTDALISLQVVGASFLGFGFNTSVSSDGTHVWVANAVDPIDLSPGVNSTVIELSPRPACSSTSCRTPTSLRRSPRTGRTCGSPTKTP